MNKMTEYNYNYVALSMTRDEYNSTDFYAKTMEFLKAYNGTKLASFEKEQFDPCGNGLYAVTYKITITDENNAVDEIKVKIDKDTYWASIFIAGK